MVYYHPQPVNLPLFTSHSVAHIGHSTIAQSHNTMLGMLSGGKKMIYSEESFAPALYKETTYRIHANTLCNNHGGN